MPSFSGDREIPIFTIGYGARSLDAFLAVLRTHDIAYLIDVRSAPYSKFKPEFSKNSLERSVIQAGLRYVHMGETLGGQPLEPMCYEDGKVLYDRMKESPAFKEGVARLQRAHDQRLRLAIMCSEGKPEQCHRTVLIGQVLTDLGIAVTHIDENDILIDQAEALSRRSGGQLSLLDVPEYRSRKRYKKQDGTEQVEDD